MADYNRMYKTLFNAVTDALEDCMRVRLSRPNTGSRLLRENVNTYLRIPSRI